MALAETAELVAELNLKGDFQKQATKARTQLGMLTKDTKKLREGFDKVGKGIRTGFKTAAVIGASAAAFLAANVVKGFESLAELEDVTVATNQAIKSTRGVADVTADAIRELSERYEDLTTVDDKAIQGAANLLLSFTNVRKKAFEPTIAAALDMAEALDMDVNASVRSLGKALNDPIAGLTRLTRLGVSFTEQEKRKIKTLVESGRTLDAQRLILGKLNRLYGGRAEAAARGYRGTLNRLKDTVEELQMSLAEPLIRPLTRVARKLNAFAKTKDVQDGIRGIGEAFAGLFEDKFVPGDDQGSIKRIASPFTKGLGLVQEAFDTVKTLPWETIRSGLDQTFQVAAKAVDLFKGLPPELQTALVTLLAANKLTGGLVASGLKDIGGLILKSLTTIMAGNVTVIGTTVTGPGVPGAPGAPGTPTRAPSGMGNLLKNIATLLPWVGVIAMGEESRREGEALLREQLGTFNEGQRAAGTDLDAIRENIQTVKDRAGQALEKQAQQRQISGTGNDLLRGLTDDQRRTDAAFRAEAARKAKADQRSQALAALQIERAARVIPALGDVRGAVMGVTNAIHRKDLSVRVSNVTTISGVTVAQETTRVYSGNRAVIS